MNSAVFNYLHSKILGIVKSMKRDIVDIIGCCFMAVAKYCFATKQCGTVLNYRPRINPWNQCSICSYHTSSYADTVPILGVA